MYTKTNKSLQQQSQFQQQYDKLPLFLKQYYFILSLLLNFMFNRDYVALSYYEKQVKQSIKRTKLLAELQSKLIITDLKNGDLRGQLNHLKIQNKVLREKLQEKQEKSHVQVLHKQKRAESALIKANQYLNSKKKIARNLETISEVRVPLKFMENNFVENPLTTNRKNRQNSSYFQSQVKLSKAVYYNPNEISPLFNQKQEKQATNKLHKRQFSFKQPQRHNLSQLRLSESKQIVQRPNQFESRAIQMMKIKQQPEISEQLKRWKSDGSFGNQSELYFGSKAHPSGKRKTYLSIVSVSSKGNKL